MPKLKQVEFSNLPDRDALGKAVVEYLNAKEHLEKSKEEVEALKKIAVEQFLVSNRASITVNGVTVLYKHTEKDTLQVKGEE